MAGNFADSNRASLRYLAEDAAAWGSTPASGSPREMRITTSKLAPKKETKTSDELRSDRMIPSIIEVGASADGDVSFEFSAGAIDDFLAAFVYGLWSRPMGWDTFKGVTVSIVSSSSIAISGGDFSAYITPGRRLKLEGFKNLGNNRYVTVGSVAYSSGSGITSFTVTPTVLTAESGSAYTKILDANDVIVMANTTIRFGTAGASTIDSNGGNAFASARAAGQLKVGQKIHVDGHGYDLGTVDFGSNAAAGDTLAIFDGKKRVVFQFGGILLPGYIGVGIGADADATAGLLKDAINAAYVKGLINVVAALDETTVDITNLEKTGGSLIRTGTALTVTDFAGGDDTLRGVFTITSVGDDVIGVTPKPNTFANGGAFPITIKGSMLRNPAAVADFVRQSFTIETSFEDVNQHFVGRGLRVGSFELNVQAGEIVNGSVSFMGKAMERNLAQVSLLRNSPYTPKKSTSGEVLNATSNVGELTKNGAPLATAVQSISLKGDASLREQRAVANKYAVGIGVGRFQLTGSLTAYFETGEMFDDFVNHATVSLGWYFQDNDNARYDFTLPAIKMTSDPVSPDGIDKDVIEQIDWEAQRDPVTDCMIQVDRFSSVKACSAYV